MYFHLEVRFKICAHYFKVELAFRCYSWHFQHGYDWQQLHLPSYTTLMTPLEFLNKASNYFFEVPCSSFSFNYYCLTSIILFFILGNEDSPSEKKHSISASGSSQDAKKSNSSKLFSASIGPLWSDKHITCTELNS